MPLPFLDVRPKKKTKTKQAGKEVAHLLRQAGYGRLEDLLWSTTFRLPAWTEDSPLAFFETSEAEEREGGLWAVVVRCTLPRGLMPETEIALGQRCIAQMFPAYAGLAVLHVPLASDGLPQPHFHFLFSARLLDEHERPAAQFFKRYNAAKPWRGGARKDEQVTGPHYPSLLHDQWDTLRHEALGIAPVVQTEAGTELPGASSVSLPGPVVMQDPPKLGPAAKLAQLFGGKKRSA